MIFDSWASLVPENYFEEIIISPTKKIINSIDNCYTKITYPKGIGKKIIYFNKNIDSEILSIDHNVDLNWLLKNIPSETVLQGNLNPIILKDGGFESFIVITPCPIKQFSPIVTMSQIKL